MRCPYCGEKMELDQTFKSMMMPGTSVMFWYSCDVCGAEAPRCNSKESANAAATQRYVEPLKPLELHEVTGSEEPCVFLEINNMEPIWACDCVISSDLKGVHISFIGDRGCTLVAMFDYCKTWRCWARRPTDEEREAAGWVDEAGE